MEWRWLLPFMAAAASILFVAIARMRISIQKQAEDLRLLLKQLDQRTTRLNKARERSQESKQQLDARTKELTQLRSKVVELQTERDQLRTDQTSLMQKLKAAEGKICDLTAALARSEVSRVELEKNLSAASLVRWELQSRLQTDEAQRISALNGLRQYRQTVPTFLHVPIPEPDEFDKSPHTEQPHSPDTHPPLALTKSPMEPLLLELRPDLTLSDDEDDVNEQPQEFSLELGTNMRSLLPGELPPLHLANQAAETSPQTLEVHRSPWSDANSALTTSFASIATALGPECLQAGVVCHGRVADGAQLK